MKDITLVTINWSQQPCVELLLKSYVKHHYKDEPLNLYLVDNGSTDGSKEWLKKNEIPFVDLPENAGHENGLNKVYNEIETNFVLLVDTDVEFKEPINEYLSIVRHLTVFGYPDKDKCISVGELIDKNYMNDIHIKDRISPWFWLFDISKMRAAGIKYFRDPSVEDWTYDVGSWHWEQMKNLGFENYNIHRKHWNQDNEVVSMPYEKFDHIGKVSWNLNNHQDRYSEVMKRRYYVQERLKLYEHIDLKGKFI